MKNLMFLQQVITMRLCDICSYNFTNLWRLMHRWCIVRPNINHRSRQQKMEEQKEARRVSRLNYAKQHPIQKRSRKDSIIPKETLSVDAVVTYYMKKLMYLQQVIIMTLCHICSYNFICLCRLMHRWCIVPSNGNHSILLLAHQRSYNITLVEANA
jgi:hypothetical protein